MVSSKSRLWAAWIARSVGIRWYVGEDVKETIGLSGISGLWIFGRA